MEPPSPAIAPLHRHYALIDVMRFFAAMAVMLYHFLYLSSARQGKAYWLTQGMLEVPEAAPYTHWGWIGVQIFFVISGFVITLSAYHSSALKFVKDRIIRLGPGVWICATLSFLIANMVLKYNPKAEYVSSLIFNPFGPWIDPVYWTLGIEMAFYTMVFFLLLFRRLNLLIPLVVVLGVVSSLHAVFYLIAHLFPDNVMSVYQELKLDTRLSKILLIEHGCFFAVGVLLAAIQAKANPFRVFWLCVLIAFCCIQIIANHFEETHRNIYDFSFASPLLIWLTALVLILASSRFVEVKLQGNKLLHKVTRELGLMTYPLYLIHITLGCGLMGYLLSKDVSATGAIFSAIAVCIVVSWFISSFIEPPVQQGTRWVLNKTVLLLEKHKVMPQQRL